jgi:hypothetical protein
MKKIALVAAALFASAFAFRAEAADPVKIGFSLPLTGETMARIKLILPYISNT